MGPYSGEAGGTCQEAPISAEKCAARREPRDARGRLGSSPPLPQSGGRSTHQSSSTTRTSTKNVFLLTRFLNVSANGENFSYVEDELKKPPCSRGQDVWRPRGAALSQPLLTGADGVPESRERGRDVPEPGHGKAQDWCRRQGCKVGLGPDSSQPPPSPACRTVPTAPPRPAWVGSTPGSRQTS